jgi:hypothetical protein
MHAFIDPLAGIQTDARAKSKFGCAVSINQSINHQSIAKQHDASFGGGVSRVRRAVAVSNQTHASLVSNRAEHAPSRASPGSVVPLVWPFFRGLINLSSSWGPLLFSHSNGQGFLCLFFGGPNEQQETACQINGPTWLDDAEWAPPPSKIVRSFARSSPQFSSAPRSCSGTGVILQRGTAPVDDSPCDRFGQEIDEITTTERRQGTSDASGALAHCIVSDYTQWRECVPNALELAPSVGSPTPQTVDLIYPSIGPFG